MARVCFVIQHPLSSASDLDSPSGTLTIVRLLLDHWGHGDELVVLCNKDFAKLPVLRALQREVGFQIAELPAPTVQDQRARICYRGQKGAAALLSRTKIGLLAPVTTAKALRAIWAFFTSSNIEVVFSHSGGYPHANLNLLAVIAAKFARIRHNYLIVHNVPDPVFLRRLPFSFVQGPDRRPRRHQDAFCFRRVRPIRGFGTLFWRQR